MKHYFLQLMGFHSFNLFRSCRLVVDTGIHAMGWTRQRAVDYLLENTALSPEFVGLEVDRYITNPGQATSYKIGEIQIQNLRKELEKELGKMFDVKEFHRHLLDCFGPLNTLDGCVRSAMNQSTDRP